jgi:Transcriptional regulatory protein, C terminal
MRECLDETQPNGKTHYRTPSAVCRTAGRDVRAPRGRLAEQGRAQDDAARLSRCPGATPDETVSRTSLVERVWGEPSDVLQNLVDDHVSHLRKKVDRGDPTLSTRGSRFPLPGTAGGQARWRVHYIYRVLPTGVFSLLAVVTLASRTNRNPQLHSPSSEGFWTRADAYWTTSSARASSDGGIVSPSAFAVLRLITSSNFVGCSMGRSPGLAPLRIRST